MVVYEEVDTGELAHLSRKIQDGDKIKKCRCGGKVVAILPGRYGVWVAICGDCADTTGWLVVKNATILSTYEKAQRPDNTKGALLCLR
jgi:hypothetical protein